MTNAMLCLITAPQGETASKIAKTLTEEKLAACVNIVPGLRSIYQWKGEICDDEEALLIVKTRREMLERLNERIQELHPYDTPEFLALDVEYGAEKYLKWIDETLE